MIVSGIKFQQNVNSTQSIQRKQNIRQNTPAFKGYPVDNTILQAACRELEKRETVAIHTGYGLGLVTGGKRDDGKGHYFLVKVPEPILEGAKSVSLGFRTNATHSGQQEVSENGILLLNRSGVISHLLGTQTIEFPPEDTANTLNNILRAVAGIR